VNAPTTFPTAISAAPSSTAEPSAANSEGRRAERSRRPLRLGVLGWSPDTAEALAALAGTGRYLPAGIADRSGTALVRAREATGLPCHQRVAPFVEAAAFDALLVDGAFATDALALAPAGCELLFLADTCDTTTLEGIAHASGSGCDSLRLRLMRPVLQEAGFVELRERLASPGWAPRYLDIVVEAATDATQLLATGAAMLTRLAGAADASVRAEAWGAPTRTLSATVETAECMTRLQVRHAPEAFTRISGDSEAGAFEYLVRPDGVSIAWTRTDGSQTRFTPEPVAPWAAEADRIAAASASDDRSCLHAEASLLDAVQRAALSGDPQSTDCCQQPALRVLRGGGNQVEGGRPPHLRLVVS
jgi:hypothetical protein